MIKREIDGIVFGQEIWPATYSMKMLSRLLDEVGNGIVPFVEGTWALGDVLHLLKILPEDKLAELLDIFVGSVFRNGNTINGEVDAMFSENKLRMFKVFAFTLEVQYKDFFEQGLSMKKDKAETQSK